MPDFSLTPGSVNVVTEYNTKYWVLVPLEIEQKLYGYYRGIPIIERNHINPPLVWRTRFVLPIKGAYYA